MIADGEVVIKIETPDTVEDEKATAHTAFPSEGGGGGVGGQDSNELVSHSGFGEGATERSAEGDMRMVQPATAERERAFSNDDPDDPAWTNPGDAASPPKDGSPGARRGCGEGAGGRESNPESSACAAYVTMSLNLMDLLEDHTVITSLLNDYIFAFAQRNLNSKSKNTGRDK